MVQERRKQGDYIGVIKMTEVTAKDFGKAIKKRLIELDMTQAELAKMLGMTRQELSRMLKGKRPGYKYREKMLQVLKLDANDVA